MYREFHITKFLDALREGEALESLQRDQRGKAIALQERGENVGFLAHGAPALRFSIALFIHPFARS